MRSGRLLMKVVMIVSVLLMVLIGYVECSVKVCLCCVSVVFYRFELVVVLRMEVVIGVLVSIVLFVICLVVIVLIVMVMMFFVVLRDVLVRKRGS